MHKERMKEYGFHNTAKGRRELKVMRRLLIFTQTFT